MKQERARVPIPIMSHRVGALEKSMIRHPSGGGKTEKRRKKKPFEKRKKHLLNGKVACVKSNRQIVPIDRKNKFGGQGRKEI